MKKLILLSIFLLCISCATNTGSNSNKENTDTVSEEKLYEQAIKKYLDSTYEAREHIRQNLGTILFSWNANWRKVYSECTSSSYTDMDRISIIFSRFELNAAADAWKKQLAGQGHSEADSILKADAIHSKNNKKDQFAAFPMLRRLYALWCAEKYWIDDIDVKLSGNKNQYIRFVGTEFSTNRNIQKFHDRFGSTFKLLRFEQVRYSWYSAGEYSYYTPFKGKDSDPVITVLDSDYSWGTFPNSF